MIIALMAKGEKMAEITEGEYIVEYGGLLHGVRAINKITPLVRCKDCKHFSVNSFYRAKYHEGLCKRKDLYFNDSFFCKWGERRD